MIIRTVQAAKTDGMTLIEMLVVIAIIAILAAIFSPTVGMMQERSRRMQCKTNLREIGLAVKSYMDNHNDAFVSVPSYNLFGSIADKYREEAQGAYSLFFCPSQDKDLPSLDDEFAENLSFPSSSNRWTTYEFNGYLNGAINTHQYIEDPSICAYVYDYPFYNEQYNPHGDAGVNVLYMDWHVEWLPSEDYGLDGGTTFTLLGHVYGP